MIYFLIFNLFVKIVQQWYLNFNGLKCFIYINNIDFSTRIAVRRFECTGVILYSCHTTEKGSYNTYCFTMETRWRQALASGCSSRGLSIFNLDAGTSTRGSHHATALEGLGERSTSGRTWGRVVEVWWESWSRGLANWAQTLSTQSLPDLGVF